MIPVSRADEQRWSPLFDATVRRRGMVAIDRLLGKAVTAPGRKPREIFQSPEEIAPDRFPAYWTEVRPVDGRSTLDDMMDAYGQYCAYLAMRIERATGSPTVDHFVAKERDWRLVYEWSNYRLSAACVNGAKGTRLVIDPFEVQAGWFELNLDTCFVRRGTSAPAAEHSRIDETLAIINLRQCVDQRREFISDYRDGEIDLQNVERYAPFIAMELRRQGQLMRGDV